MKKNYASKEKIVVVELISVILIFTLYSFYVYNRYIEGNPDLLNDFRFWGKSFLILIPVSVIVAVAVHVVFAIFNAIFTREEISGLSDERDKLIELKSIRISHSGFMLAMGFLAWIPAMGYVCCIDPFGFHSIHCIRHCEIMFLQTGILI